MPLDLQTSLLRAIETRTIVRIGGHRIIPSDVRIIAATHKDLREEARRGNFRSDLYYRLDVLAIKIPALRERPDDLPLLVQHFLQRQSRVLGRGFTIAPEALAGLRQYAWPGNVRELENMLERITYLMPNDTITVNDLPIDMQQPLDHPVQLEETEPPSTVIASKNGALKEQSVNAEVQAIISALLAGDGHTARAAALLGISRTTLWRKMVKYGLIEDRHKN